MAAQRIVFLTVLASVLTAVSAFFGTKVTLAAMEPDEWLWDASFATVNNLASVYRSEVIFSAEDYSTNGFQMPILANPYRNGIPCDGTEKLITFYEYGPPLNVWPVYATATARKVWVDSQTGCQMINCDNGLFNGGKPNNNCSKSVRPNYGEIMINTTEIQWFPFPQNTTAHEIGHPLGRGHAVGDIWVAIIRSLNCDPVTVMFDKECRLRWIDNHGGMLFNDLQSDDIIWIQANYP